MQQEGGTLSAKDRSRGYWLMVASGSVESVGLQVFAMDILQLIAWQFGGREPYIGQLAFMIWILTLAKVFVIGLTQHRSRKAIMLWFFSLVVLAGVPVLLLPGLSPKAGLILLASPVHIKSWCV